jgi:hypothetical protein
MVEVLGRLRGRERGVAGARAPNQSFTANGGVTQGHRRDIEALRMISIVELNALVTSLRSAVSLVQRSDNPELLAALANAQGQLLAIQATVFALLDENRELKQRLTTQQQLTFRKNAYWVGDNEGPYCSRCWDAENKLVRLHLRQGYSDQCPSCGNDAVDPEAPPPKPVPRERRSPWINR